VNRQRLSAILLLAGFAALVFAAPFSVPGLYRTTDPSDRVEIIEQHKSNWNTTQSLVGLGILLTASGFFVLNTQLYTVANAWITTLGAAAFIIAAFSGAIFIYRQTTDPLATYEGTYKAFQTVYYALSLTGLLFFGIVFLQAGFPGWLGYATAGAAIVFGIVSLITDLAFLTPYLVTLLSLVIAIILLRQRPLPKAREA
jgi:hypothetical protein